MRKDERKRHDAPEHVTEPLNAYQPRFDSPQPLIPITEDLTELIREFFLRGVCVSWCGHDHGLAAREP